MTFCLLLLLLLFYFLFYFLLCFVILFLAFDLAVYVGSDGGHGDGPEVRFS
jgi:hypothetical protein